MINKIELDKRLSYNKDTGVFVWVETHSPRSLNGKDAGYIINGYIEICIDGKKYKAHRLAWLTEYGEMPNGIIDHINGIRNDNRISNLRITDKRGNAGNQDMHRNGKNCGVTYYKETRKWVARIRKNGKQIYLGSFEKEMDAVLAYRKAI